MKKIWSSRHRRADTTRRFRWSVFVGAVAVASAGVIAVPSAADAQAAPTVVSGNFGSFVKDEASFAQVGADGSPVPTLELTAGAVPLGMVFHSSSGVIDGVPTAVETYTFTVTATNVAGSVTGTFTGEVAAQAVAPTVISSSFGSFVAGAFSFAFVGTDGSPAATFAVTAGALPGGCHSTRSRV